MSLRRMCGVVLWSNPSDHKAVVWCEDQGNLAYYVEPCADGMTGVALDAGDLIEFELREDPQMRRVTNPILLVEDHAPDLAQQLNRCANTSKQDDLDLPGTNVVPFPQKRGWRAHLPSPVIA